MSYEERVSSGKHREELKQMEKVVMFLHLETCKNRRRNTLKCDVLFVQLWENKVGGTG